MILQKIQAAIVMSVVWYQRMDSMRLFAWPHCSTPLVLVSYYRMHSQWGGGQIEISRTFRVLAFWRVL